jgi:hypothetical protein
MWEISKKSTSPDATAVVGDSILITNLSENMNVIKWYASKTIWFNILMTIIGIATSLQGVSTFDKYAQVLVVIILVGNVILRTWFTNSSIASSSKVQ